MEADELLLSLRHVRLSLSYWVKLKGSGEEQPATKVISNCLEYSHQRKGRGFGWNINYILEKYGLYSLDYGPIIVWGNIPLWILLVPHVNLQLVEQKKEWSKINVNNMRYFLQDYLKRNYYSFIPVFTDGSEEPESKHVGTAMYIPEFDVIICRRITDRLSVLTAEITSIILAFRWIEEVRPEREVICSDSIAALHNLNSNKTRRDDLVMEILMIKWKLQKTGISLYFCCLPAHVGVEGDEKADNVTKEH